MEFGDVYVFGYNGLEQLLQKTDMRILKTPMKWQFSLQKGEEWAWWASTFSHQSQVRQRTRECHLPQNSGATFIGETVDNHGHGSEGYSGAGSDQDNRSRNLLYKHTDQESLGLQMKWNATLCPTPGFVMGCLNGEMGKFIDLSNDPMTVVPSSTRKLCLHEDKLYCINDSGDCLVRECTDNATTELDIKVLVECAPVSTAVLPTGGRQASWEMEEDRCESQRKELPESEIADGYLQEVGDAPGNKAEEDSIVGFTNLSAGDSHVLATNGPDNRPGKIKRHEDGAYIFHPFRQPVEVQELACGKEHALLLTAQGLVYSYGMGSRGQLGHGEIGREDKPKLLEAIACVPMATVSAGGWHSTCISTIGDLYIWGWNESGQLGLPPNTDSTGLCEAQEGDKQKTADQVTFQMVPAILDLPGGVNISKVSCGTRHTAAVTYDKRLYTWGWGKYGQLGHGDVRSRCAPELVDFFLRNRLDVLDVTCGDWSTAVYTSPSPQPMPR